MTRAPTPQSVRQQRFRIADETIARGGNMTEFAEAAGISPPAALKWLRRHAPERLSALVDGRQRSAMDRHTVLVRLLWLKALEGQKGWLDRVCRVTGVSQTRLHQIRRAWAPDGLDAAIDDLMPDGEVANG
jgi:hypothetical protein